MGLINCVNLIGFIYFLKYKMPTLKKVTADDLYETIHSYVESNKIIIEDYNGMINAILRMIKDGYCFTLDRGILRDAMESLTYMYAPSDDINKDRLIQQFEDDIDEEEEEAESEEDMEGDMIKMMQMMGMRPPPTTDTEEVIVKKEESAEATDNTATDNTTTDSQPKECSETVEIDSQIEECKPRSETESIIPEKTE